MSLQGKWSRTMNPRECAWSGNIIKRGEIMRSYDEQSMFVKKIRELISPKLAEKGLPIGVRLLISEYYSINDGSECGVFSEESANFDVKLTRRGRVIRKPIRLENETFITGSGISGCDQYDRAYDDGDLNEYRRNWVDKSVQNLSDFVVSDGAIEKENSGSEEECGVDDENCDNWSETDDDDFSDSEWGGED